MKTDKYISFRLNSEELKAWKEITKDIPHKGISGWVKRKLGVLK